MLHWCWNAMSIFYRVNIQQGHATPHGWQVTSRRRVTPAKEGSLWALLTHWNLSCNVAPSRSNLLITAVTADLSALFFFLLDVTVLKGFLFQLVIGSYLIEYMLPAGVIGDGLATDSSSLQIKWNWYFINETNILEHLQQGSCLS